MKFKSAALSAILALGSFLTAANTASAVDSVWEYSVQVSATVQASPAQITLSWPQDVNGVPSNYTISRKAPTASSWSQIASLSGSTLTYTDTSVSVGTAYEYRVTKTAGGYYGYGYIEAGIQAPLVDSHGKVLLIVDKTVASSLASELTRLQQDLAGDGWTVQRFDVNRTDSVTSVKSLIVNAYNADRANVKSVFLFGHVPVPYSGQLNPDGHGDHVGAWPADVYYGDVDGNWTDNSVNYAETLNTQPADAARLSNFPGDGKFDQTQIPSSVELEVGRVDLSNMPGRTTWGGPATFQSETELLRAYLNRDHNFRHAITRPARRAILGDYFGSRGGEAFAASGFRIFAPIVGSNNIRNLNVEFNDQRGVWISESAKQDNLLAYACGAGSYTSMGGIGNAAAYNTGTTPEVVSNNVRGVFNFIFGSWFGDWDSEDNMLRAPLATSSGLVSVWSGRPHWYAHALGLGETIGYTTRVTQNNNGLYQTAINAGQNNIHIALMGDPTLRVHAVVPPSNINGAQTGSSVSLTWLASSDSNVVGYHVYRATSASGPFTRLTSSPISNLNYTDSSAPSGATYMVRAVKLETSASGSYYNASQGLFWSAAGGSSSSGSTTTTPTADTTAPTVSISSPGNGATLSGSVSVTANASDNTGVAGVQFKLDGANLGSEVTSSPFTTALNTSTLSNAMHTLTAIARDAAGNKATATTISVTVNNTTASSGGTTSSGSTSSDTTSGGTSSGSTSGSTTSGTLAGTTLWFDDALPAGAGGSGTGGDGWNWVTSSPAPVSGSKAHQTNIASGLHEHAFAWGNTMSVASGEVLVAYVYLDPANQPTEVMLSWFSNNWEHRAYWGANKIGYGTDKTASRYYVGALPAAGQWVRLEVPASAVGLEGQSVMGMGFSTYDGRATYDAVGKAAAASSTSSGSTSGSTTTSGGTTSSGTTSGSTSTTTTTSTVDTLWFDDALPNGAVGYGNEAWSWVTASPAPASGLRAHQSVASNGLHEHVFAWSSTPMKIAAGEKLFVYAYIDSANPTSEIMIHWYADNWEHRAYWGANKIGYGTDGTNGRRSMGALPAAGQWVRLEVPASTLGLEGQTVTGMCFSTYDGRVTFDKIGQAAVVTTTTSTPSSGTSTSTTPTTSTGTEVAWLDDTLPGGATGIGNGETWNWITSGPTPYSGSKAHQSINAAGLHEHYFAWGSTLSVGSSEKLFVYVYLDPASPPSEVMLSWHDGSSWEHRAYWGADKISYGTANTAGRYRVGNLPATGGWVRLEVPATAVDLAGKTAVAMCFSTFDGRVTYDKAGKITP